MNTELIPKNAQPFLKWPGGKRRIQDEIISHFPKNIEGRYFEPFLGSGAIFFRLQPEKAVLSDINIGLINTYKQIKINVPKVIEVCLEIQDKYSRLDLIDKEEFYYQERERYNSESRETVTAAGLFIFLNKAGFNGMYRENSAGQFNIPFGKREKLQIFDADNLRAVSDALQKVEIIPAGIDELVKTARPKKGDFVYLDPPYIPLSKTASFTSYTKFNMGIKEQLDFQNRLKDIIIHLTEKEVNVVLSNSNTAETIGIFEKGAMMRSYPISAPRSISASSAARKSVTELVLKNSVTKSSKFNYSQYLPRLQKPLSTVITRTRNLLRKNRRSK